jgi:hypothetical protein
MGNSEGMLLNANELWLLHTLVASGQANPSDIGVLLKPKTLIAGSPDWESVCAAIDGLVAMGLIVARPQHTFGSGKPDHFLGVRLTNKGILLIRSMEPRK